MVVIVTEGVDESPIGDIRPFVLQGDRLYLRRYFDCEKRIVAAVRARTHLAPLAIDSDRARRSLDQLFGDARSSDQRNAVECSLRHRFSVITGGPGTGKTTTVVRLIAALIEQNPDLRFSLLAPTGKAAARLGEAITRAKGTLHAPADVIAKIPTDASTIHRALLPADTQTGDRAAPLARDVIIVDEASMVGLSLLDRLLSAAREDAQIVLLGDHRQLSSVDVGSVLADLCGHRDPRPPWVSTLRQSYRFSADSGIGRLAQALEDGDVARVRDALFCGDPSVRLCEPPGFDRQLAIACVDGYRPYLIASDMQTKLALFEQFRVLSTSRAGKWSVAHLTSFIEKSLAHSALIEPTLDGHYVGRPIMVTKNEARLSLSNGDVGLAGRGADGAEGVWFARSKGLFFVESARLPEHDTALCMTVHKSQGSEFDDVVLVLPDIARSGFVTRQLLYTAVTRAKKRLTIFGAWDVIERSVARTCARASGIEL
jgi:exodeoxyribonuclease V alpha subunit